MTSIKKPLTRPKIKNIFKENIKYFYHNILKNLVVGGC